jgi:glyoxylase-like metal-dependent hydrolase (beta-lactamase superfamily II)
MRLLHTPTLALAVMLLSACASAPPPEPPPAPPQPPPPAPARSSSGSASSEAEPPAAEPESGPFAGVVIKVEKVAGNVYVLEGAGGNIGVSIGEDGIVLVDDQFAPLAPKIKAALKGLTQKPLRVVLNTHWHGDHTGGNGVFQASAPVVAHDNVRKRMATGSQKLEMAGMSLDARPPAARDALPIVTFADKVSVHLNGEEIRAIHVPSGHTDGDVIVHFTQSKVVHMGDDFVTYGFPFVDLRSGGSVKGIIAVMDKVVKELPADVKVIPGHGKVSTLEDIKKLSATLKECVKLVEAEVKKKKTLAQIQEAKVLAKYADMGKGFVKTETFVETIYRELTKQESASPVR